MAQAQISTGIGTFVVDQNFTITSDMGITKIIVSAIGKATATPTIQGTLKFGNQKSAPVSVYQTPITIEGNGQPLNNIILTGQIQVIAFQ